MIVGFVGFIGSGKDTAADYLVNFHGFRRDSFASTLKDAVAAVFAWDRTLLEGRTLESRQWREKVDFWWSNRLGKQITPRWVLQNWGTEVLRNHFHDDIWIASLENKLRKTKDNIVISDVRFPNEITAIHSAQGIVIRIKRGKDPDWYKDALNVNQGSNNKNFLKSKKKIIDLNIHSSETSWVGGDIDRVIDNDSSIDNLFKQLKNLVEDHLVSNVDLPYAIPADNLHRPFSN